MNKLIWSALFSERAAREQRLQHVMSQPVIVVRGDHDVRDFSHETERVLEGFERYDPDDTKLAGLFTKQVQEKND